MTADDPGRERRLMGDAMSLTMTNGRRWQNVERRGGSGGNGRSKAEIPKSAGGRGGSKGNRRSRTTTISWTRIDGTTGPVPNHGNGSDAMRGQRWDQTDNSEDGGTRPTIPRTAGLHNAVRDQDQGYG
ncbi:hypothetical protein NQ315_009597 [Exocentrus adspersus]|uniref:Uncharacterized protein n=1 Tax=Exocentrus adspersus TaxID=1586481 RepID=A0AAV8WGH9_9CUCU|nr:hypothetical protein NQ315_009597 [Exocentrus adspersus]